MDYRLHKIDSEEKNRILSLHESATKKEYLNSGKKPLFEQGSADRMVDNKSRELASNASTSNASTSNASINNSSGGSLSDVVYGLQKAYGGAGTKEGLALQVFSSIPAEKFDQVIAYLMSDKFKVGGNTGLVAAFNDEYGLYDIDHIYNLKKLFEKRNSGFEINYDTYGLTGKSVRNITITGSPNQIPQKGGDQVSAVEPGKGREQVSAVEPQKERGMNATQRIQQELGVTVDGKVGPDTINAMYDELYK